eukprot:jgi/Undpi1/8055/HiC_scaffold_24.g10527.m1
MEAFLPRGWGTHRTPSTTNTNTANATNTSNSNNSNTPTDVFRSASRFTLSTLRFRHIFPPLSTFFLHPRRSLGVTSPVSGAGPASAGFGNTSTNSATPTPELSTSHRSFSSATSPVSGAGPTSAGCGFGAIAVAGGGGGGEGQVSSPERRKMARTDMVGDNGVITGTTATPTGSGFSVGLVSEEAFGFGFDGPFGSSHTVQEKWAAAAAAAAAATATTTARGAFGMDEAPGLPGADTGIGGGSVNGGGGGRGFGNSFPVALGPAESGTINPHMPPQAGVSVKMEADRCSRRSSSAFGGMAGGGPGGAGWVKVGGGGGFGSTMAATGGGDVVPKVFGGDVEDVIMSDDGRGGGGEGGGGGGGKGGASGGAAVVSASVRAVYPVFPDMIPPEFVLEATDAAVLASQPCEGLQSVSVRCRKE